MGETANVPRTLRPGQRCEIRVASAATGLSEVVFSTGEVLLEAPNWTRDGTALILNGAGGLWRFDLAGQALAPVPLTAIPGLNNDHVLSPDGASIYLSADDGHIYRADLQGGEASRVTAQDGTSHFLHGISPDGASLAFVGIEAGDFRRPGRLMTMPAAGGPASAVGTNGRHSDGPEYSPDGEWLYFNTEAFTSLPGHAQIARVRVDGSGMERLVRSGTVDWFPHLSPDGASATYLQYPPGTLGHPADLPVRIVAVRVDDWSAPLHSWQLTGGQGSLNVNSWAPDSTRFAYVAYPFGES